MRRGDGGSWLGPVALVGLALGVFLPAGALAQHAAQHSAQHSGHHAPGPGVERSVHRYDLPEVTLLSQDRNEVPLAELVDPGEAVVVDFVFATCTTICPVLSASFSNLQRNLGDEAGSVRLVSITIDPEHDTPEVMKRYRERFRARPGWDFVTGDRATIDRVLRAFDAYVPDKMSHQPLILLRGPREEEWVRLRGFPSADELLGEVRRMLER